MWLLPALVMCSSVFTNLFRSETDGRIALCGGGLGGAHTSFPQGWFAQIRVGNKTVADTHSGYYHCAARGCGVALGEDRAQASIPGLRCWGRHSSGALKVPHLVAGSGPQQTLRTEKWAVNGPKIHTLIILHIYICLSSAAHA